MIPDHGNPSLTPEAIDKLLKSTDWRTGQPECEHNWETRASRPWCLKCGVYWKAKVRP